MKLTLLTESDYPILKKWFSKDENLFRSTIEASKSLDLSKPNFAYLIWLENEPVGWISLFNIESDKAEFGIAIPEKKGVRITIKASVAFLRAVFIEWGFSYIYVRPSNIQAEKAAKLAGFNNEFKIALEDLERKWLR